MNSLNITDYPRRDGESDDAPRINRAIADAPDGQIYLPNDKYIVASPIEIGNHCSLEMQELAVIEAATDMDFVVKWNGRAKGEGIRNVASRSRNHFLKGGTIDGHGFASCMNLTNYWHFTMRDVTFLNGKHYGLQVGKIGDIPAGGEFSAKMEDFGVELMANNLYFQCTMGGMAGNVALSTNHTDSHYTDIITVDYTTGVEDLCGGSNRYTRVHSWVGVVPDALPNSVCYSLKGYTEEYGEVVLDNCYADTGMIGFDIYTHARLLGCSYFNNYAQTHLDGVLCIRNNTEMPVVVANGCFTKTSPNTTFYQGNPNEHITFRDNILRGGLELDK